MKSEESVSSVILLVSVSSFLMLKSGWASAALVVGFESLWSIDYTDAGATSVGVVGVPFDAESMRFIAEVPSLAV